MRFLFAMVWIVVGAYALYQPRLSVNICNAYQTHPQIDRPKRKRRYFQLFGIIAIAIGLWHLIRGFQGL